MNQGKYRNVALTFLKKANDIQLKVDKPFNSSSVLTVRGSILDSCPDRKKKIDKSWLLRVFHIDAYSKRELSNCNFKTY